MEGFPIARSPANGAPYRPGSIGHNGLCSQAAVSNPQRLLTDEWVAVVLSSYLTDLLTDDTLLQRLSLFCARRGYTKSYPVLAVMD